MAEANRPFLAAENRRALQMKYTDITDVLDADQLSAKLFSEELISREDFQNLQRENDRAGAIAQAKMLVDKLQHKSDEDLERCVEIAVAHQPEMSNYLQVKKLNLLSNIQVIRKKIELIEGKNKMYQDQVSSSESQMNEVRDAFDGVRAELDQERQTVLQKINSDYDRDVKLLDECKKQEIEKLQGFMERNEYDIGENNKLVSFTKETLQSPESGILVKEFSQGLSRKIDDAISKKSLDHSTKIKLPRLKKNACNLADENILSKIQWVYDTNTDKIANHKVKRKNIISCLTITGIFAVIIAVCMFHALQRKQVVHINSDFRHVNQSISEVMDKLSPAATDIYTLPSDADRMTLVNDTIWIPLINQHSIAVITLNGTKENINFPDKSNTRGQLYPRAVLQVNTSEVLLASDKGLYVVDSTRQIQYTVAKGNFNDVSKHDDKVIALQWISHDGIRLHSLKYDNNKWIADKEHTTINMIPVSFGYVTMTVYDESVYINSRRKIYKYSLDGQLKQKYGTPGSPVGVPSHPHLSAVDPWGTVLVCNRGNARLQTLSAEGEWREYRLVGWVRQPRDVCGEVTVCFMGRF